MIREEQPHEQAQNGMGERCDNNSRKFQTKGDAVDEEHLKWAKTDEKGEESSLKPGERERKKEDKKGNYIEERKRRGEKEGHYQAMLLRLNFEEGMLEEARWWESQDVRSNKDLEDWPLKEIGRLTVLYETGLFGKGVWLLEW